MCWRQASLRSHEVAMPQVVIVNFGAANVGSVTSALRRLHVDPIVTQARAEILSASKLILPGVGSFDAAMANLHKLDLVGPLTEAVIGAGTPVLGICLGMQLFAASSEEGHMEGLGWIPGRVCQLPTSGQDGLLRLPHLGWSSLVPAKPSRILSAVETDARYYFAHSYHFVCADSQDILTTTTYGIDFASSVERGRILGTQFHPEKSHDAGRRLLREFLGPRA